MATIFTFFYVQASIGMPVPSSPEIAHNQLIDGHMATLRDLLIQLKNKYKVNILFDDGLVNQPANRALLTGNATLEQSLTRILKPHKLYFKKVSEDVYLITREKETKSRSTTTEIDSFVREEAFPGLPDRSNEARAIPQLESLNLETPSSERSVEGKVTDEKGEPLPGVNVLLKGTTRGLTTDVNGYFSIEVPNGEALLVFSFVGYQNQELVVGERRTFDVLLKPENNALDEVVVIGYQTVRKGDVSTAISSISEKDIQDIPVVNVSQALIGKIPGLTLQQTSGAPGNAPVMRIRGSGSISSGNNPLYVIDGYPTSDAGLFNSIPPSDIESVDVLKDAAAAAIYGSRAGNGVIVVTTKSGKTGQSKITLDLQSGWENVSKKYSLLNPEQYAEMAIESRNNNNSTPPTIFTNPDEWARTDWQDAIFQTAKYKNYQIGISGGDKKTRYSFNLVHTNQEGIIRNSWFERYNARVRIDTELSSKIRAGFNLSPSFTSSRLQNPTGAHNSTNTDGIIAIALSMPPIIPIYQANGDYTNPMQHYGGIFNVQLSNPVQKLDANKAYEKYIRMSGNFYLEYEPINNLKIRSTFNTGISSEKFEHYIEPFMAWNTNGSGNISTPNLRIINASRRNSQDINWYISNTMSYLKSIRSKHNITFLIGYDVSKQNYFSTTVSPRTDASNPIAFTNTSIKNVMGAVLRSGTSSKYAYTFDAIFGRAIYNYKDKYTLSASLRQDRSSRFGPNAREGIFPSLSAAWRITEENWMKSNNVLSDLKVRASYGSTGNDQLSGIYPWVSTLSQSFYIFGKNSQAVQTMHPASFSNIELNWEKNIQTDIGVDFSILNNRISFTYDWYNRNSNSILAAGIPSINGISNSYLSNVGNVQNRGSEISILSRNIIDKIVWNTNFNISFNKNKITNLGTGQTKLGDLAGGPWSNVVRNYVGRPMGDLYLYVVEGTFNSNEDLANYPKLGSQIIGDLRFKDTNGDGVITTDDMTLVGNYQPNFTYGITNSISTKHFDISITIQGSQGGKVINAMERQLVLVRDTENSIASSVNRWKSESNPGDGFHHKAGTSNLGTNIGPSTRFLYDASYIRIRNIVVSYNIPDKISRKIGMNRTRLYLTAQNLLTFSKYSGYNPEGNLYGNNAIQNGIDQGTYPLSKNISIGINMNIL